MATTIEDYIIWRTKAEKLQAANSELLEALKELLTRCDSLNDFDECGGGQTEEFSHAIENAKTLLNKYTKR